MNQLVPCSTSWLECPLTVKSDSAAIASVQDAARCGHTFLPKHIVWHSNLLSPAATPERAFCIMQGSSSVVDHISRSTPSLPRTAPQQAHQAPVGVLLSASRASLVATISTRICDMAAALLARQPRCRSSERGRSWHEATHRYAKGCGGEGGVHTRQGNLHMRGVEAYRRVAIGAGTIAATASTGCKGCMVCRLFRHCQHCHHHVEHACLRSVTARSSAVPAVCTPGSSSCADVLSVPRMHSSALHAPKPSALQRSKVPATTHCTRRQTPQTLALT